MGLTFKGAVHISTPTFLYESLWNAVGFCILFFLIRKLRTFDGELFLCYLLWYGAGRFWIEGLRTDSLYLFQTGIRVSQLVALLSVAVAAVFLIRNLLLLRHTPGPALGKQSAKHTEKSARQNITGGNTTMATIIDGKALAVKCKNQVKTAVADMEQKPGLAVILVGENPASQVYVKTNGKTVMNAASSAKNLYCLPTTARLPC